jgi:sulfate adenylyltransferase (ADP) / ATP adenylyltransferase
MANVGSFHTLIFSKHCVFRPVFVLHTKKFAPQTDDLDISDYEAAWAVLRHFRKPQMMIYNCGVDAGSSQGHKHMQIFPRPTDQPFALFPENCRSTEGELTPLILHAAHSNRTVVIGDSLPFVSHRHYILSLPESTKAEDVFDLYQRLLAEVKGVQRLFDLGPAYNVALTSDWLCLIPRRNVNKDGVGANAAGMLGLVWLRDQEERDGWSRLGYTSHLEYLGVPMDTSKM